MNYRVKKFEIITLFEEAFPGTLDFSIFKRSKGSAWDYKTHDLRKFGIGKHKIVDDEVFSNLPGMLIRPDVIDNAMHEISNNGFNGRKVFMSPRGKMLTQSMVEDFASTSEDVLILCGRYEGVDQRAIDYFEFEEISIGNYILAGGEIAALVFMEAIIRKLPQVVGNSDSFINESFADNKISENRFTRPAIWNTLNGDTLKVEEILLSGDHKKIAEFQKNNRKDIK